MADPVRCGVLINAVNWLPCRLLRAAAISGAVVTSTAVGFLPHETPVAAATTQTYVYDARGRIKVTCQAFWYAGNRTTYSLDNADNRTNVKAQNQAVNITAGSAISSVDGRFNLTMQTDGNFVLYGPSGALWHTNTYGTSANVAAFQSDGNLVLYNSSGTVFWHAGINSHCASLVVQNDGNVVILATNGAVVWQTNTGGH